MKQITEIKFITSILFLLLAGGCTQADVIGKDTPEHQSGEVEMTFNLKVAPNTTPKTRSITFTSNGTTTVDTLAVSIPDTLQTRSTTALPDAQEKKVVGLWIGQYDATGNKLLSNQYIESVTGTQVTAKLVAANNCHVRFVANAGNLGNIATEALLNAKTLPYASTDDGRPQSNLFAMTGTWTGNITKSSTSLPLPADAPSVKLTRLAAKITFTYKINGTGFSFTPTSVSLINTPDHLQIGELTAQLSSGVTYGTYSGTINTTGATIYWYLAENMAGTGTPSVNSEKEKTGQGVGIANATCVELKGKAVQNGVTYENVVFTFYPGNNANDYNIKRNDHFIMNINLRGLDISDKRITVGTIPSITVSPAGNLPVAAGGTKDVLITSRAGVVWSLPLPTWLSATIDGQTTPGGSTLTNQGACMITLTAAEMNQTAEIRSKEFTIELDKGKSESFTISQDASSLTKGVDISLNANTGESGSSSFTATSNLPWNATFTGNWLAWADDNPASSGTHTTGTAQELKIKTTASNPSAHNRMATIEVRAGNSVSDPAYTGLKQDINVTQAGSTLTGSTLVVAATPATGTATFTATPNLPWTATSNVSWITVTSPSGGPTTAGNNIVAFNTTTTNPNTSLRTGQITVTAGGQPDSPSNVIVIRQGSSEFSFTAPTAQILQAGGNVTGSVTATPGLPWTISPSTNNGITVSPTSGSGSATLTFSAAARPALVPPRTGRFTVSVTGANPARTLPVEIIQKGDPIVLTIDQALADAYKAMVLAEGVFSLAQVSAFNYDGGRASGTIGSDRPGCNSATATIRKPYYIEIAKARVNRPDSDRYNIAVTLCPPGWRIPTAIEVFAAARNRSTLEVIPGFQTLFPGFWCSSVFDRNADARVSVSIRLQGSPGFPAIGGSDVTKSLSYTRCIREIPN